jgi:hypothetical protein
MILPEPSVEKVWQISVNGVAQKPVSAGNEIQISGVSAPGTPLHWQVRTSTRNLM